MRRGWLQRERERRPSPARVPPSPVGASCSCNLLQRGRERAVSYQSQCRVMRPSVAHRIASVRAAGRASYRSSETYLLRIDTAGMRVREVDEADSQPR